jgi:hypothetical protein
VETAVKNADTEPEQPPRRRMSPSMLVAAGLGVALLVGAVVTGIALNGSDTAPADANATGPVPLVPVDAPQATSPGCVRLMASLPRQLPDNGATITQRQLVKPAPPAAAAWGDSDNPVVLRCGVEQPPEFTATSELFVVNGVQWLQVNGDDATTWYAVDRAATVALTEPGGSGSGPIQVLSTAIATAMPPVPLHPSGS